MNCSVVIPVYNSAHILHEVVRRLELVLVECSETYEVILVNDGSPDESWTVIDALSKENSRVRGINLMKNYGQHNALLCGVRAARFEVIVTMDDDLQHPPEEIPRLLEKLEGNDVVYGIPRRLPHSWWRNIFSSLTKYLLAKLIKEKNVSYFSAFRAFRTNLRRAFEHYNSPDVLLDVLLSWGAKRYASVELEHHPRSIGTSNYTFSKLLKFFSVVLTSFSTVPLRFANFLGFFFVLFGFAVLVYVLWIFFFVGSIPGFPFLASIICLFSGGQFFALGIIGEYLARVFERSVTRPAYVIEEDTETLHTP